MDSKSVIQSLSQFVNAVEEMEQAILVPHSLQDMSLSNNGSAVPSGNGVVLEKSLFEAFTVLRNIKNVVLTGHALDDKSEGNPISDELLSLMKTLGNMTGLAKNLTDEYKTKFNLLF
ncbi:hypothetical protein ACROYT_G021516 [Oculina patagonica]